LLLKRNYSDQLKEEEHEIFSRGRRAMLFETLVRCSKLRQHKKGKQNSQKIYTKHEQKFQYFLCRQIVSNLIFEYKPKNLTFVIFFFFKMSKL
jgi:hypothetical protein